MPPVELDEADLRILRALQDDARHSMRDLAQLADISTPTASQKVKALEAKGLIGGYVAKMDPQALGEHVLILEVRVRPSDVQSTAEALAGLPEVRVCHTLSSGRILAFATLLESTHEGEFLGRVAAIKAISRLDTHSLLATVKDLPLAVIDRGVGLAVRCEFCGKRTKGEMLRVKVGDVVHFVCCASCKERFEERVRRLEGLAARGKTTRTLPTPNERQARAGGPEHAGHSH